MGGGGGEGGRLKRKEKKKDNGKAKVSFCVGRQQIQFVDHNCIFSFNNGRRRNAILAENWLITLAGFLFAAVFWT